MKSPNNATGVGIQIGAAGVILLLAMTGLAVVYRGAFNVAATEEHASFAHWALDTTFHRSVRRRAAAVVPPSSFAAAMADASTTAHEVFWLVKHGAKMTGMPAFGPTHDDQTLWNIVALVKELPAMTPERHAALGEHEGAARHHGGHH